MEILRTSRFPKKTMSSNRLPDFATVRFDHEAGYADLAFVTSFRKHAQHANGSEPVAKEASNLTRTGERSPGSPSSHPKCTRNGLGRVELVCAVTSSGEARKVIMRQAGQAASSGQRVLILDCDLRNSAFTAEWRDEVSLGISDLVNRKLPSVPIQKESGLAGVDYIPSGCVQVNPISALMSQEFLQFLAKMRSEYDLVLLNTPPYRSAVDAFVLAKFAEPTFTFACRMAARDEVCTEVLQELEVLDLEVRMELVD